MLSSWVFVFISQLRLVDVPPGQFHLLSYLQQGLSMTDAHQQLIEKHDLTADDLAKLWPIWKKRLTEAGFFFVRDL